MILCPKVIGEQVIRCGFEFLECDQMFGRLLFSLFNACSKHDILGRIVRERVSEPKLENTKIIIDFGCNRQLFEGRDSGVTREGRFKIRRVILDDPGNQLRGVFVLTTFVVQQTEGKLLRLVQTNLGCVSLR